MRIALCGSTRFRKEFEEWNAILGLRGHVVYSLSMFGAQASDTGKEGNTPITDEQKVILDLVHLLKIETSDAVLIVNPGGYVGDSTYREILWALMRNKELYALEQTTSRALPTKNVWIGPVNMLLDDCGPF